MSRTLRKIARAAVVWLPAILLILVFAKQGWAKFSDASGWAVAFRHWGYPDWFRVTIGVIELSAAALLLWGRTAFFGAALIVSVMLGAMATHLLKDGGRHLSSEVVPLVLASLILVLRRPRRASIAVAG